MTPGTRTAVALALGSFVLYNANVREISSQDTVPNRVLPYEVIEYGRLDLDRLFRGWPADAPLPFWIQRVGTHYRSNYPVVPALLAVPVYAGPVLLGAGDSWPVLNALSKLAASLFAALSVVFVYLAARELARRQGSGEAAALATAAVYAFATPTWAIASQGLWGHGPAQLGLAVSLWAFLRHGTTRWGTVLAGLAAGVMVASRPSTGLVAAVLAGFAVLSRGARRASLRGSARRGPGGRGGAQPGDLRVGPGRLRRASSDPRGASRGGVGLERIVRGGAGRCPREPEPRALHLLASAPVPRRGTPRLACPAPRRAPGMRGRRRRGRHRDHRAVLGVVGRTLLRPPPARRRPAGHGPRGGARLAGDPARAREAVALRRGLRRLGPGPGRGRLLLSVASQRGLEHEPHGRRRCPRAALGLARFSAASGCSGTAPRARGSGRPRERRGSPRPSERRREAAPGLA